MDSFLEETFRRDPMSLKWKPMALGLTQTQLEDSFPPMSDTLPHHGPSRSGPSAWLCLLHQCGHYREHLKDDRQEDGRRQVPPCQGSDDLTMG